MSNKCQTNLLWSLDEHDESGYNVQYKVFLVGLHTLETTKLFTL